MRQEPKWRTGAEYGQKENEQKEEDTQGADDPAIRIGTSG
jgi:hypothetical protein